MKLKVKILRIDNVVIAKILEQDEDLRSVLDRKDLIKRNGYLIASMCQPEIKNSALYIRGREQSTDNKRVCKEFNNVEKAIEWCTNIRKLIDEINEKENEDWDMEEY